MTLLQYAVSKWIGHSMAISERHYANAVPNEVSAMAIGAPPHSRKNIAQRQAQVIVAATAINGTIKKRPLRLTATARLELAKTCETLREKWKVEPGGIERLEYN